MQRSLLDPRSILGLGMSEDDKNFNFVYRLTYNSTKIIMERKPHSIPLDLSIPVTTTHIDANPWNPQEIFKENVNHNNNLPHISHTLIWELDPNDNRWFKRFKMMKFHF